MGGESESPFSNIVKDTNTDIIAATNPLFVNVKGISEIDIAAAMAAIFGGKVANMENIGSGLPFDIKPPNTPKLQLTRSIDEAKSPGLSGSGAGG
jgi:hypothetical protein